MSRHPSRLWLVTATVCLLALTAGCLGGLSDDSTDDTEIDEPAAADADTDTDSDATDAAADGELPTADEVIDGLQSYPERIDDLQGTQVTEVGDDETTRTVAEVLERPPADHRTDVVETNDDHQSAGDKTVMTGDGFKMYDSEENVLRTSDNGIGPDEQDELFEDDSFFDEPSLSVEGTDTVADRDVYVIEYEIDRDGSGTMWVDQEYWYPIKQHQRMDFDDGEFVMTAEFEDIEFNVGLDDSDFELDVPEDAEVTEFDTPDIEEFDSIEAAEEATGIAVPDYALPEEFELNTVSFADGEPPALTLQYQTGGDYFSVRVEDSDVLTIPDDHEAIDVNGADARLNEFGDTATVAVECDTTVVQFMGQYDADELIEIAETLDC